MCHSCYPILAIFSIRFILLKLIFAIFCQRTWSRNDLLWTVLAHDAIQSSRPGGSMRTMHLFSWYNPQRRNVEKGANLRHFKFRPISSCQVNVRHIRRCYCVFFPGIEYLVFPVLVSFKYKSIGHLVVTELRRK